MKKGLSFLFALLVLFAGVAGVSAEPSETPPTTDTTGATPMPAGMPGTIHLLETTPLYPEPDESLEPWGALSPQDVQVVRTLYGDQGFQSPMGETWIQIHTDWLGDMWIKLANSKLGVIRPFEADLKLGADTPLYDEPFGVETGAGLAPQTVHAAAMFESPTGFIAFQIDTSWLGKKWLIQPELDLGGDSLKTFPDAVSPDYGQELMIHDIRVVKLADRYFAQGKLSLHQVVWHMGRLDIGITGGREFAVSGALNFWNEDGDVLGTARYSVVSQGGEPVEQSVLLPLSKDVSAGKYATIQTGFPYYFGLPVPPNMDLYDADRKVYLAITRTGSSGSLSVSDAMIRSNIPGRQNLRLTLVFYGDGNRELGRARVHQTVQGAPEPIYSTDTVGQRLEIVGEGDWTKYTHVDVLLDSASPVESAKKE